MVDLERTWNSKFNYPWTFFNDVPFTDEFKKKTQAATKAKCNYGMRSAPKPNIPQKVAMRKHTNRTPRTNPQRTLGRPLLDQQRPLLRIRRHARGAKDPIWQPRLLPPNVPLELGHVLPAPRTGTRPLLLARRAQSPFLLRRRLRRLPLHGGPQQDIRLYYESIRCAAELADAVAGDAEVPGCASGV